MEAPLGSDPDVHGLASGVACGLVPSCLVMAHTLDAHALTDADMFASLDHDAREVVTRSGMVRALAPGRIVFGQGDPGVTCHTLLDGRVKIVQARADGALSVIRFIGPGETYGTVAALMGRPFPADAVAVVESLEIYWPVTVMRDLMTRYPAIAMGSAATAGQRLFELQERVSDLSSERVERRIARILLRLAGHAGRKTSSGLEIDFPVTRQELAEMAGSTLHTVSRTLAAWDEAGLIGGGRRRIVICDLDRLTTLAGSM